MLPGKHYTPDDVLAILRRRFWLVIVPCAVAAAVTALLARRLPDRYRSEAVVLVVPQQVPEMYVRSGTPRIEDRVQVIAQELLSRARLERIIDDFGLYRHSSDTPVPTSAVDRMRDDISISAVRGNTFRVAYVGPDANVVQQVTTAIASLFIEENLRGRSVLVEGTSEFLQQQLDEARRRLVAQEKKLEEYRMRNSGHLPSQLTANLQALQGAQAQLQTATEAVSHDRDQLLILQGQLADLQAAVDEPPVPAETSTTGGTTAERLATARNQLAALSTRYKPTYPEIPRTQRLIRDLEAQLEAENASAAAAGAVDSSIRAVSAGALREQTRSKRIKELQVQLDQLHARIAENEESEKRLRAQAAEYQQRIDQVPARESEMTELTRDYGTLQTVYTNLLSKKEESNIAANLERRQEGEQFRLLDPAIPAQRPFAPNRIAITAYGAAAGLAIGVGLIVLLEFWDTSFKTDAEVASLLALPVLSVVPLMLSAAERRHSRWRRRMFDVGLGGAVGLCAVVVIYTLAR
jgi:polysaccharide chain length determinant protein (PEP-CTERM system associated)